MDEVNWGNMSSTDASQLSRSGQIGSLELICEGSCVLAQLSSVSFPSDFLAYNAQRFNQFSMSFADYRNFVSHNILKNMSQNMVLVTLAIANNKNTSRTHTINNNQTKSHYEVLTVTTSGITKPSSSFARLSDLDGVVIN